MTSEEQDRTRTLAHLLAWYAAMGVDAAVDETAHDWLARPDRPPPTARDFVSRSKTHSALPQKDTAPQRPAATPQQAPRAAEPPPATGAPQHDDGGAIDEASRLAAVATSLEALEAALRSFDGCALKKTAKSLCFMRGADQARLMVIGEAPGRDEDRVGRPFVGRAGQLLDRMLAAIGHDEANTHITNIVYWRPPANRTPNDVETATCRPFLERQIELVNPDVILLMGGAAAKSITGETTGITRLRGRQRTMELGGAKRLVLPTLHPAYLLRTPAAKRMAWLDLLAAEDQLKDS